MILSFQSWQMLTSPWFLMLTGDSVFYATNSDKFHSSKTDISFCSKAKKQAIRYHSILSKNSLLYIDDDSWMSFPHCEVLSYLSWSHLILRVGLPSLLPTSQVKKNEASKKWQSCPTQSSESTWNPECSNSHSVVAAKKKSTSWKYFI